MTDKPVRGGVSKGTDDMRYKFRIGVTCLLLLPLAAAAGPTQQACLQSDRSPGPKACLCVQQIADQTLSPQEQSLAAGIIVQPDLLETYLSDDRPGVRGFVDRYREWGARAASSCRG